MVSQFQTVLEKIIIPQFPDIHHVEVVELPSRGFYRVTYVLNRSLDNRNNYIKLMEETTALYKMLTPDLRGDIIVEFENLHELD